MCGRKVVRKSVRQETIHAIPSNKTMKPLPLTAKQVKKIQEIKKTK